MEIILKEDVPSLGKAGQIVKVREGYGRNFLLPSKKAVLANPKNVKELEHYKKMIAAKQSKLAKQANEVKTKLDQFVVNLSKEVGEEGKLFGSVTSQEIAEALRLAGFSVDKRSIHLAEPIRALGDFQVSVKLHSEVSADVKVVVSAK